MIGVDYLVLTLYMLGVLAVGLLFARLNRSASDMFAAGGQSPWWASGLSGFMTMFSAGTFVVWGGIAYKFGFVAVAINLCYGVAALAVGYFVAGRWKRLGIRTPAQFIGAKLLAIIIRELKERKGDYSDLETYQHLIKPKEMDDFVEWHQEASRHWSSYETLQNDPLS